MSTFPYTLTARVLSNFGFVWGEDFTVVGRQGEQSVVVFHGRAHKQAAYNADRIEDGFRSAGMQVNVNFDRTPSGGFHTHIAVGGDRQRQGHFMDTDADRLALGLVEPQNDDKALDDAEAAVAQRFPEGTRVFTVAEGYGPVGGRVMAEPPVAVRTPGHANYGRVKVLVLWTAAAHTYTRWAFADELNLA